MATGVTVTDPGSHEQLGFNRIKKAGAGMTRVTIYWSSVAPSTRPGSWNPANPGDPNYNWAESDAQIRNAVKAGLVPMVQIFSAPRWAERCKRPTAGICNPDPVAFARFSKAAAKRYSGHFAGLPRIRYWEPWNEPNLHLFFQPQFKNGKKVSPRLYRALLNRFAIVVKRVKRTNKVIAGGLAPLKRPGGLGPLDFMRRVLCMKGRKKPKPIRGCKARGRFDIWANNPYTTGGPRHHAAGADDVSLGDLPKVKRLLVAAKKARKIKTRHRGVAFWVTEFSWDSAPPDSGGVPMKRLARWVPEAMYRSWRAGVRRFFWLSLRDWNREPGLKYSSTIESGLYFRGKTIKRDRPKKILRSFRFPSVAFRRRGGIRVWGRTPNSSSGWVLIQYSRGSGWRRVGYVKANGNGIFRKKFRTRLGRGKRGVVRAVYHRKKATPFPLRRSRDYYQPPFG